MTINELRELLLSEHKRDKKLTLINYGMISVGFLILFGLLYYFAGNKLFTSLSEMASSSMDGINNKYAIYYKLVIPIAFGFTILYPFYKVWQISKRPQKIEEMLDKIKNGSQAVSVDETEEYKITIPLIVIRTNLKICPVTYAYILLNGEVKPYIFPIRKQFIPEVKLVLSGANMEHLNEVREALFNKEASKEGSSQNTLSTPIKSVEEFREFIQTDLGDSISQLEGQRKSGFNTMLLWGGISVVAVLIFIGYVGYTVMGNMGEISTGQANPFSMMLPVFIAMAVFTIGGVVYSKIRQKKYGNTTNYEGIGTTFKDKVFSKMIAFINPTVEYSKIGHIGLDELMESGVFVRKNYNISGNDQISGWHNGVPFISCDLTLSYKRNFSDEKESPDSVFYGQFFMARFNKQFASPVYILPRKGGGFFSSDTSKTYVDYPSEKVHLEDVEFMDMFHVYSTDQVEARYILTPSMMERIKDLARRTKGKYIVVFYNNKITVANNSGINNFEFGYSTSLTKNESELLINFYKDLADQFAIIDELKLNVKIWG